MDVSDVAASGSPGPGEQSPVEPGRVAVVTGAASGIGLGLSQRFAAEGMNVVMADVEEPVLAKAAAEVAASAGNAVSVLPVVTDVSDRAAVGALRDTALSAFGAVHVVCNNAGALGPYGVSKHAVTALTETLHFNLKSLGAAHVGVSVLCPGAVRTNFGASARNRPSWAGPTAMDEAELTAAERFNELTVAGAAPAEVAGMVVDGIRSRRFYILTSANRHEPVLRRAREIVSGLPPEPPVPFV
jgi:NAD(P)-dependent dehydrogenase (short-subunit alcohol dehydrogenase family)